MAKRGRSSKYSPERVEQICTAIARTGSDRAGWQAGDISSETFYRWINEFPEFSEGISNARAEYRETCPETLIRQANKAFADYLYGRMERVIVKTERGSTEQGSFEKETIQRVPVGIPRWAIERVLGPPISEIDAIKVLAKAGWLPNDFLELSSEQFNELRQKLKASFAGILPDLQRSKQTGISAETADAIRKQILGLEPESVAPLPGEVGRGQVPSQGVSEVAAGGAELG
ncbi:MAG TPA: hypothetical protein V6D19_05715 [Stenomitos sp.]